MKVAGVGDRAWVSGVPSPSRKNATFSPYAVPVADLARHARAAAAVGDFRIAATREDGGGWLNATFAGGGCVAGACAAFAARSPRPPLRPYPRALGASALPCYG